MMFPRCSAMGVLLYALPLFAIALTLLARELALRELDEGILT
jgi:hypothetical protein